MKITAQSQKIELAGNLNVTYIQDGKYIVAQSAGVDVSGFGETTEEAEKMFFEALSIYFEDLMESGNLVDVLSENGWQIEHKKENEIIYIIPPFVVKTQNYNLENLQNIL